MSEQCRLTNKQSLYGTFVDPNKLSLRNQIASNNPLQCECAYVGRRPLSWAIWIPGLSQNALLDSVNKEFSHQHIFLNSGKDNIGFGPEGFFNEENGTAGYHMQAECLNGSAIREAIKTVDQPSYYGFFISNCQTYIERIMETYKRIISR